MGILQEAESDLRVLDAALAQRFAGAIGEPLINCRVRDAVEPASARHAPAAGETVAGETHPLDAQLLRICHQNPENNRMQMQMQVAIDVVERQTGGEEF